MTKRSRADERAALHEPWPTSIEQLEVEWSEWEIFREVLESGSHGDWIAQHTHGERLRAKTPDQLKQFLEETVASCDRD